MKANSTKSSAGGSAVLDSSQPRPNAEILLVGLDWGTNTSSVVTALRGSEETITKELVPTVVGYATDDVLPGVLPGDAKVLFGRMALKHKSNLRLVRPLQGGVIHDTEAAEAFVATSNLAWFGRHLVQDQFLQFSQLRALEFQRPVLHATNTGPTAGVDHRGRVVAHLEPLSRNSLVLEVEGRRGSTPYARWLGALGLWPLWLLALAPLAWMRRKETP